MCKTIVITTTEQAEAMLKILEQQRVSAEKDDFAAERRKPIRRMTCTCCGEGYRGRQWFNQDCGYGCGDCCAERLCNRQYSDGYGVPGIHFLVDPNEKSELDVNIGWPLHDVDDRLRIDCEGYVYWKGIYLDHWSSTLLHKTGESIAEAKELIRRCEHLETTHVAVSTSAVVWNWEKYSCPIS